MVSTVEKELSSTGDGTKLADYQAVSVDRVVIQHIVLFEQGRVVDKIVIYGIVPNRDVRIPDDRIQIDRLGVIGTWISFCVYDFSSDLYSIGVNRMPFSVFSPVTAVKPRLR